MTFARGGRKRNAMRRRKIVRRRRSGKSKFSKGSQPVVAIGRPVNHGFPRMMKFTHRYIETLAVSAVTGTTGSYIFSANGMFDPYITGGGNQPLCFDNMTAIYDQYCVIGSKIKVKICQTATNTAASYAGIFINDDTSSPTSLNAGYLADTQSFVILPQGGVTTKTLSAKFSARKWFSYANPLAKDSLQGTAAANPTEQSYYEIIFGSIDQSSNSGLSFVVDIEYIAIWTEPKDQSLS